MCKKYSCFKQIKSILFYIKLNPICLVIKLINFNFSLGNIFSFWIWCLQHIQKRWGGAYLPLFYLPFSLHKTLSIWELRSQIADVLKVKLFLVLALFFYLFLFFYFICSTSWPLHYCILCLTMHHIFTVRDRSGQWSGQSRTCTLFLRRHTMWTYQTTTHLFILCQSITDEVEPREVSGVSGCCLSSAIIIVTPCKA